MTLAGRKALVVGMERSGVASVELLVRHRAVVRACDLKPLAELPAAVEAIARLGVRFDVQTPEVFEGAELIVLSPGVPADLAPLEAARRRGVEVIGEVELAGWFLQGPVIGITGANGKTTTTALTAHLLRESGVPVQVGGNIGTPATSLVEASRPEQWNVLELSSFQLETIRAFRARIGACLNVTPDHLDRHGTFQTYAEAKGRLFDLQQPGDWAVLNAGDATCSSYAARTRGTVVWFSLTGPVATGAWLENGGLWFDGQRVLAAAEIPIRGRHNIENTLAALVAARLAGARLESIAAAVRSFQAVEHRLEFVRRVRGIEFYNDSKATNVDATLKALDAFDGGLWVILGGKDKGSDYTPLAGPLRRKARAALLVGEAAPKIAAQLGACVTLVDAGTVEAAVAEAWRRAAPGDTVLLAPACASFDQFRDYQHRGAVFKQIAGRLTEN